MRPLFASLIAVRHSRCESEWDIALPTHAASPEPGERISASIGKQTNKLMLSSRALFLPKQLLSFVPDFNDLYTTC